MRATGRPLITSHTLIHIVYLLICCAAMAGSSSAQFTNLVSFNGTNGMNPYREALVQAPDGNFYGTAEKGGANNFGVVFRMASNGTLTLVHEFVGTDGEYPSSGLVRDTAGNLYGTARAGGPGPAPGVIYKITPQGTFSVLTGGLGTGVIYAPLLLASDGNLYAVGSSNGASGTVFKVGTDGSNPTVVYSFCTLTNCADGKSPLGGLVEGPDHSLYGTTQKGGTFNWGTVYRLTPTGTLTVLHNFDDTHDGNGSRGKLIVAGNGYLYGTTYDGGPGAHGTVFRIKPDGTSFSTVFSFCLNQNCSAGYRAESGVLQASDGNFYGTTGSGGQFGRGTVFRLTPAGQATAIHDFCNCGDGSNPYGDLLLASDGNFYGTTYIGGSSNEGTVFRLTGPPTIQTTSILTTAPNPSHYGQNVTMTATVHAQNGTTPTGNVVFSSDGVAIGTAVLNSGVAVLNYSALPMGTHAIVALYQAGNGYAGSTSNTVQQVVQLPLSTTTLTSVPNPSTFGQQVTITATVGPDGPPMPTGTVSFTSNGTVIAGCTSVQLVSQMAQCVTSALAVGTDEIVATYSGDSNYAGSNGSLSQIVNPIPTPVQFFPAAPCRVVDTRNPNGPFGGPILAGNSTRSFPLSQGGNPCNIPAGAVAYSLNVTVAPMGHLGYLSIWPTGQGQPIVSTLNSPDGRVKANAAIVPAGSPSGGVSVYVTNTTHVILDIDGYFAPPGQGSLQFYPLTPCRVVDTRGGHDGGTLQRGTERDYSMPGKCEIPANAAAYSFNITVVPAHGGLDYLTVWPAGGTRPTVSTLNDPTGTVVANAAIVPAGTGTIAFYPNNNGTDLLVDSNGYFAAPAQGGYSFYAVTPCRVYDSRSNGGQPFRGTRTIDTAGSQCGPPANAGGYVFNATVVPANGPMGYLTLWPNGQNMPVVSTLNAYDGLVTSNMAIVPNVNGSIDAYADGMTHLIMDISGYFAP